MELYRITALMNSKAFSSIVFFLFFCCSANSFGQVVTFQSLLEEMVDRDRITQIPNPAYQCCQSSSYDRDAVSPEKQETWYTNWDRSQFLRTEKNGDENVYVMLDEKGPGAIVRFWGTWDGPSGGGEFSNGRLSIYVDGSDEPIIEGPIKDVLSGQQLAPAPLSQGVSPKTDRKRQGHNLYLPIPFAKGCKVTYSTKSVLDPGARKGEALYYQINFRKYESGSDVKSLTKKDLQESQKLIQATCEKLKTPKIESQLKKASLKSAKDDSKGYSLRTTGSQSIHRLFLEPNFEGLSEKQIAQQLRSTIIQINFDGRSCVWCPLGDFFGIGYKLSRHETWYTKTSADGKMECFWRMPFKESCEISLKTLAGPPIRLRNSSVEFASNGWDNRSMHFHAGWNSFQKLDTGKNKWHDGKTAFDLNYVKLEGQGVYVGDSLSLFNPSTAWWGEGDEKIYVDEEKFPSHFGTGTEDYYGYAWCRPETFSAPFHAQPCGQGNLTPGYTVNSRFRSLDAIPYKRVFALIWKCGIGEVRK